LTVVELQKVVPDAEFYCQLLTNFFISAGPCRLGMVELWDYARAQCDPILMLAFSYFFCTSICRIM